MVVIAALYLKRSNTCKPSSHLDRIDDMAVFDNTSHPGGETVSIWQGTFTVPSYEKLKESTTADCCVVGAGIAGLSTAYLLVKAGKKVVVVDDGPIGGGETGRTTAHLTAAMDDRIYVLEKVHGHDAARQVVESHTAAIHRIEMIVKQENIDCDFKRLDGYLFSGKRGQEEEIDKELQAAHRAGLADVRKVDRAPIANFETGPALKFPEQAQFHSLKYIAGLAKAIIAHGGRIFCGSHVAGIEPGKPCKVQIEGGLTVTADAVCVCTNGSISDMVHTHTKQAPYRTCVIGLNIPRGSVEPALYWDMANPYHYVRLQPIDSTSIPITKGETLADVLIVGGEDFKTAHDDDVAARWQRLEAWARERWPQAGPVLYRWSGQVLEPNDYLAFIGRNPDGAENVYMASGDSGQGMTHGMIAGMILSDLVQGREHQWAKLYDPRRVTLNARPIEEFAKENLDVAVQYAKDFLSPGASEDDIPRGEGRVIRRGVHKIAAYRDDSGTMHYCSALCTHLKCVVGWNTAEKSWDCPCHGSRFDPKGKVLNGPAVDDLSPA
jgi:glycine/D-amino acid oxidase-like deaminating enzyme/nitrite reductase/ring-hydroxylating ferredoxin subunit